ncbi:MAG: protein kinase, partial [Planctomycetes bacterium]|nr:protein kinase [Planctomycetota bacterium]
PKHADDGNKIKQFLAEAAVSAKLDHPNILPVHELDYTDGLIPFFSMRLASGQTLEDSIKDPQVFSAAAPHMSALDIIFKKIQVMSKVCEAMVYAHSKGIVHSDIKPGNIMLGEFGDVQLVDWGTSTTLEQRAADEHKIIGTPIYMSPEQARKECCDQLSDIYCIGTSLFHLISGRFPMCADDIDTFWQLKREGRYDRLNATERHHIPPGLIPIIEHCLEEDRELRYQSVTDVLKDLRNFQKGEVISVYHDPILSQIKRIAKKNKKALGIASFCCACVVIIGYFIYQEKLKELSHWHEFYHSDLTAGMNQDFTADWTTFVCPTWQADGIIKSPLRNNSLWRIENEQLLLTPIPEGGFSAIVSHKPSFGNLKVSWTVHSGEKVRDLNMFIAGNTRFDAYTFHIGGFGKMDQIRLTKYQSLQTLVIHSMDEKLAAQQTYDFTAIKEGPTIQLYMNDTLVIDYTDPIPYVGPQHQNFGFETVGVPYAISNITAWNQALPQKVSPLAIADDFFSQGYFQSALDAYEEIIQQHNDIAAVALFRASQCLYNLNKRDQAQFYLNRFMQSYPKHSYLVHAYSNLCTISLDAQDWDQLYLLMDTHGKEFNHLPEVTWLFHNISAAIIQKYQLQIETCELKNPMHSIFAAHKELAKLDSYFTSVDEDLEKTASIIIRHLNALGCYQDIVDLYPHASQSADAYLMLGQLDKATELNPTHARALSAHALQGNTQELKKFLDNPLVDWRLTTSLHDETWIRDILTPLCPPDHPYLDPIHWLSAEEAYQKQPDDFLALIGVRRYQEAAEVYEAGTSGSGQWQYGQLLSILGQEDEVITGINSSYAGSNKVIAYSTKLIRLWIAGKHDESRAVSAARRAYSKDVSYGINMHIFPVFLEWSLHQDKDRLKKELRESIAIYEGRYNNSLHKNMQYIVGDIDQKTYLIFLQEKMFIKDISDFSQGLRAEISGDNKTAIGYYHRVLEPLVLNPDMVQFLTWRIQELSAKHSTGTDSEPVNE